MTVSEFRFLAFMASDSGSALDECGHESRLMAVHDSVDERGVFEDSSAVTHNKIGVSLFVYSYSYSYTCPWNLVPSHSSSSTG